MIKEMKVYGIIVIGCLRLGQKCVQVCLNVCMEVYSDLFGAINASFETEFSIRMFVKAYDQPSHK